MIMMIWCLWSWWLWCKTFSTLNVHISVEASSVGKVIPKVWDVPARRTWILVACTHLPVTNIWRGDIWRGNIWLGTIWRGNIWQGNIWQGNIWREDIWRGNIWRGTIWYEEAYLNLKPLVRITEVRCDGIFLLSFDTDDNWLLQSTQAGGGAGGEPCYLPSITRLCGKLWSCAFNMNEHLDIGMYR